METVVLEARVCCHEDCGTGGEGMLSWRPWYWRRGYVVMKTVVLEVRVCCQGDRGTEGEGMLSGRLWYWR